MSHNHNHGDHSHHHHAPDSYGKAFAIGITLNIIYVILEAGYGWYINSSALLADAGHNLSDVLSLIFAWLAILFAKKQPSAEYTYGLKRTTILVSILNAVLLFGAAIGIGYDAIRKFFNPVEIPGTTVMIVASVGIVINTATALLFMKGQKDDLNIKGAFLHMAADAGVSLAVVVSGLLIYLYNVTWIDPVMSLIILVVIVYGTWGLFKDSVNLALDKVPEHINLREVNDFIKSLDGVESVHDLHIWAMSTNQVAMTVHIVRPDGCTDEFLEQTKNAIADNFDIDHITLQVEQSEKLDEHDNCGELA
jgi:cobalt-zinc-cadmium efflux system protein